MLLVAALSTSAAIASATTASDPGSISYTARVPDTSSIITTDAGSLVDDHGVFKIVAADGTVHAGTDLSLRVDDFIVPTARRSATTPQRWHRDSTWSTQAINPSRSARSATLLASY